MASTRHAPISLRRVKRPYGEGDWFAVPLGDGRFAAGIVTHGTRKAICGSFFGPAAESLAGLRLAAMGAGAAASAVWSGRFSDRALVQLRWPLLQRHAAFVRGEWPAAAGRAAQPGEVEAMLAAMLSGHDYRRERTVVLDIGSARDLRGVESRAGGACIQWRAPLSLADLATVASLVETGAARVRLYGAAVAQLDVLASWNSLRHLALEAAALPRAVAEFRQVRHFELDGVPNDPAALFSSFPSLESLLVRARGAAFDASSLVGLGSLRRLHLDTIDLRSVSSLAELTALSVLDVTNARVENAEALLALPLAALRLARIEPLRSLAALRSNDTLHVLSLVDALDLDDLRPIATLQRLRSLELRGLWQFDVADAAFVESIPTLRRLFIDIGGRRKNAELYRRRPLALPLPFSGE